MNKKELREKFLKIRKSLNAIDRVKSNKEIIKKLINLSEYKECKLLLSYVSTSEEVDTIKLIETSLQQGKEVAVPRCEGEVISFYYIKSLKELKEGNFRILEPRNNNRVTNFEKSICIVPGICFDKKGDRIGYGKGYYDRFLSNYKGTKIGLTYKECICDNIDIDKYDINVDKVICN